MRVRRLAVAGLVAALPVAAAAGSKPGEIGARIDKEGASTTIAALVAKHKWHRVLGHIGTGRQDWLALAPRLGAATDSGQSLELTIALADALPRHPVEVLGVIADGKGPVAPARVCSAPYVKPIASDLKVYREKTKRVVEAVNVPALHEVRRACLAALKPKPA